MSRVPLSILELAPVSAGQSGAAAIRAALDIARLADAAGYRRIWFAQHHLSPGVASAQPAVLAALAADRTERIRVGSGAVLLSATSPLAAAEQFGSIAAVHPGRVDLGIGRAFTPPPEQAADGAVVRDPGGSVAPAEASADEPAPRPLPPGRMVDGLYVPATTRLDFSNPVFRRRLASQAAIIGSRRPGTFRDEVETILRLRDGGFTYDGLGFASPPVADAAFELWVVASSGGESARVAGDLGLPMAANFHAAPSAVLDAVAAYRDAFRPGVLAEPYVIVSADVLVAPSGEEARELGQPFADWVRAIRAGVDGAIAFPAPGTTIPVEDWPATDRALVDDRIRTRIVGAPDEVLDRLDTLVRVTGADELLITTEAHDPAHRERSFALLAEAWGLRPAA